MYKIWDKIISPILLDRAIAGLIIGGIIGFASAFIVAIYQCNRNHINSIKLYREKEECETNAVIKAILAEIKTLKHILELEFLELMNDDNVVLNSVYPLGTDYFQIYNANASKIGKIQDDNLRQLIISLYTTAKYFLDCLETNNSIVNRRDGILLNYDKERAHLDTTYQREYNNQLEWQENRLKHSKDANLKPTFEKLMRLISEIGRCPQSLNYG